MKNLMAIFALVLMLSACRTLFSTTTIKPNDSFILGNNEHRPFEVKLQNFSNHDIELYHAPIGGGKHSTLVVAPYKSASVKVDKNTALIMDNKSDKVANVKLKVKGDLGLSMGYKN